MPLADQLPPSLQGLARRQSVRLNPASLDISRLVSVLKTALGHDAVEGEQVGTQTPETGFRTRSRASRLLMSALNSASQLTGPEKASALAEIIRAAYVAAPERVGWLAAEAETAARSIGDASPRSTALATVAPAVAAADPERAEVIARSIEDVPTRSQALAGLARLLAQRG